MATTTNYSWTTPDDTDLVKDGAAAIRTLGSSADTTVKNLNPGTTAGDIDYYTSSTAKARIAIGTAGQVLQVNSGATAPEWATPAGGGKVLQVVSATHSSQATSTSATFADTGLTVNITPSAATSKVLIMATSIVAKNTTFASQAVHTRINRGATALSEHQLYNYTNTTLELASTFSQIYLDSPATTSSTTYKIQFKNAGGGGDVYFGWNSTNSQIIVMEIGA